MRELRDLLLELDKGKVYIQARGLKNLIPEDAQMTCDTASTLQIKCGLITGGLSELIAVSEVYLGKAKRLKEDCLTDKTAQADEKSEAAKVRLGKATKEYRALADELVLAEALFNHLNSYKKFFDNMVFIMRSKQDKEARDWQSTPTHETK